MDHPVHIHGHHFNLMKLGTKYDLNKTNPYAINPDNKYPVIKDSLLVPASGFAVTRFIADNPGKFFFFLRIFLQFYLTNVFQRRILGSPLPFSKSQCGRYGNNFTSWGA